MGVQDLQKFIETHCQQACKPVDLVQIARGVAAKPPKGKRRVGNNSFKLIVDAESCLDRLYGGYFSDWVCGGQWNRMTNFLSTLMQACHAANMELVVYFNGALEAQRFHEWNRKQRDQKQNISYVIRHIGNKGTPPPKIWWQPPAGLQTCLRMALRQLGVAVACSMDEHHQEAIGYCRENFFNGILAQDADYIIFDPPRYFSSEHLKLTYKGSLETQEYVIDDVARALDLDPKRFSILAALLGTYLIPVEELREFYSRICNLASPADAAKMSAADIIKAVVSYVRGLPSTDDLNTIGNEVFKNATGNIEDKVSRFKQIVNYYIGGTQEGFLKYRAKKPAPSPVKQPGSYQSKQDAKRKNQPPKDTGKEATPEVNPYSNMESGYATQQTEESPAELEGALDEEISKELDKDLEDNMANMSLTLETVEDDIDDTLLDPEMLAPATPKGSKKGNQGGKKSDRPIQSSAEVLRIATERHQQGMMYPWVYQLLSKGEIKLPVTLEEEMNRELPTAIETFRPIRQRVYAVLFDLHKNLAEYRKVLKNAEGTGYVPERPQVIVKEWVVPASTSANSFLQCDSVRAIPLEWTVPGTQRLWMGNGPDEKTRRIKTFLGCMNCDFNGEDNLMVNTSYVPQQLIILCCVLRNMILFCKNGMRILRKHELDAFLATAVSPLLHDVETMQEMKLPTINPRGVQLAALFMRGVDHAIFANDSCGAPIPWHMCCPWLFFDGKLFHFKLLKANNQTPLIDICDGHMDQVMRVERMRQAILQGVGHPDAVFAKPILPLMHPYAGAPRGMPPGYPPNANFRSGGMQGDAQGPGGRGMGRGRGLLGRSPVDSRGGQLQIAGVVVGNWGANTQSQGNGRTGRTGRPNAPPPQVTSVGPRGRGTNRVVSTRVQRGGRGNYNNYSPNYQTGRMQQQYQPYQPQQYYHDDDMDRRAYSRGRGRPNNRPTGPTRGNNYQGLNQGRRPPNDFTKVTLEQRSKQQGVGRGCTVETSNEGSNVVSVSELMRGGDSMASTHNVPLSGQSHGHMTHNQPSPHHTIPQQQPPHISHPMNSQPPCQTMPVVTSIPGGLQASLQPNLQGMGDMGQFEDPQAQAQFNAAAAAMIEMNKMAANMPQMSGPMPVMPPVSTGVPGQIHMNGVNGSLGPEM